MGYQVCRHGQTQQVRMIGRSCEICDLGVQVKQLHEALSALAILADDAIHHVLVGTDLRNDLQAELAAVRELLSQTNAT